MSADIHLHIPSPSGEILDIVCNFDLAIHQRLKNIYGRPHSCPASRHSTFYGKSCTRITETLMFRFRLQRFKSSELLKVTFVSFTIFFMDYLFGLSTWPLLLVKALLSALNLFFTLAFSFLDSQPTQPLSKENAGFPQSSSTFNLFCLMDYIHNQLTQLLQHETTLFTFFLVFAVFVVFFIGTCHHKLTRKQLPSTKLSSLYVFHSHLFFIFFSSFCLTDLPNKDIEMAHPT